MKGQLGFEASLNTLAVDYFLSTKEEERHEGNLLTNLFESVCFLILCCVQLFRGGSSGAAGWSVLSAGKGLSAEKQGRKPL